MKEIKKIDKKDISFIIGGAILGAIGGYIVKRVGVKNIMNMLKQKEIIPPSISNLINDFTSKRNSEE